MDVGIEMEVEVEVESKMEMETRHAANTKRAGGSHEPLTLFDSMINGLAKPDRAVAITALQPKLKLQLQCERRRLL